MGTSVEEVRRLALALPEAEEAPHFAMRSFRIRRKIFATLPPDGEHLHVFLDGARIDEILAERPDELVELTWGAKRVGVKVVLAVARPDGVAALLTEAWRRRAPARLIAALDA